MTQRDLAKKLGLSDPSYVAKLETGIIGNPRLDTIQKLSKALGVAVSELIGEEGGEVERALVSSKLDAEDWRALIRVYRAMLAHRRRRLAGGGVK